MKSLTDPYHVIGIVGLAKNTGKTTTLNALIRQANHDGLALTSIGLDGEKIDQITALPKPEITVFPKMIIATAKQCLEETTARYDIIEQTSMKTPLGHIIIVRMTSPGTILLAGPSTNRMLELLIHKLKHYSYRILIDGAFNRMTFATIPSMEGLILATGANLDLDMTKTIAKTKRIVSLFNLPHYPMLNHLPSYKMIVFKDDLSFPFKDKEPNLITPYLSVLKKNRAALYIQGAITAKFIHYFIQHELDQITLIVDDPAKFILDDTLHQHFQTLNMHVYVIHPCRLLAVTINPTRTDGQDYPKQQFLTQTRKSLSVPVFDVMQTE